MHVRNALLVATLFLGFSAAPAGAQTALDRVQGNELPRTELPDSGQARSRAAEVQVDAPANPAGAGQEILVGAITFAGLQHLAPADFANVISPRLGQLLDDSALHALTGAVVQQAQVRGYAFATAWIEPQQIPNGVLTIHVDEGRIDEIRYLGDDHPAVRTALAPLVSGRPALLAEVEHRLLLAEDIDGAHISDSRYVRERDRGILVITVERDRAAARVVLANEGTKPVGPVQLRIEADINGLLASDDTLTLSYATIPAQPRELQFGYGRYTKRVSASGTEVGVTGSISRARPGAYLRDLQLHSESWYVAAHVMHPLLRRRDASLWMQTELGIRDVQQWQEGVRVRRDRLTVARATLSGYSLLGGGWMRGNLTASQGLGVLGATERGDPLASRWDADGTFTSFQAWADWTKGLGNDFSVRVAAQAQVASDPLLLTEEAGLGGSYFLRGYDWSERSGDHGLMGMLELRYDLKNALNALENIQFYSFADGGRVGNLESGFGSGSLASAGGGIRAGLGKALWAEIGLAVPLTGPRYDTGDKSPRFNFSVTKHF